MYTVVYVDIPKAWCVAFVWKIVEYLLDMVCCYYMAPYVMLFYVYVCFFA